MKKIYCLLIAAIPLFANTQTPAAYQVSDTASLNLSDFARSLVPPGASNVEKARTLLHWLSTHFAWTSTDYQNRTVKQIIQRRGGNCFELARVYMELIKVLDIRFRPIAEINLHVQSRERQQTAEEKVSKSGNRMSVFGFQHNDHRWVEVYNDSLAEWEPVDPFTNLFGFEQWLQGRAGFGERKTLNREISADMLMPFAIFVVVAANKTKMTEDRTQEYLVQRLNALYGRKLSGLPSWSAWCNQLAILSPLCRKAFAGDINLHEQSREIEKLRVIYEALKAEYIAKFQ